MIKTDYSIKVVSWIFQNKKKSLYHEETIIRAMQGDNKTCIYQWDGEERTVLCLPMAYCRAITNYLLMQLGRYCYGNPWCEVLALCCSFCELHKNLPRPFECWSGLFFPPAYPSVVSLQQGIHLLQFWLHFELHQNAWRVLGIGWFELLSPLPAFAKSESVKCVALVG